MQRDDAIELTAAYIDDAARDVVTVEGADAAGYLQSQLSQELRDLGVGAGRWSFVLAPNGKVDALVRVRRVGEDTFALDTDAGYGDELLGRVTRFMIRVDVRAAVTERGATDPAAPFEQARIAAGWPRMGAEIAPGETIPSTTGITELAVDFTKGCYPGQELVERMDSRGADAPSSLRVLDVPAGSAGIGDAVIDGDGAAVGTITSVAPDGTTAIASVKRGNDVGWPPAHATV